MNGFLWIIINDIMEDSGIVSKKNIVIIISSLIFVGFVLFYFGTIYLLNNGNPYHNYLIDKHIPAHLEQMGYTNEDILEQHKIAPKHGVNHSVYHVHYQVIFKDEPQLEYLYGLTTKEKKVLQFCEKNKVMNKNGIRYVESTIDKSNHNENECIGYLDNRN